jgi:hypothetical protein
MIKNLNSEIDKIDKSKLEIIKTNNKSIELFEKSLIKLYQSSSKRFKNKAINCTEKFTNAIIVKDMYFEKVNNSFKKSTERLQNIKTKLKNKLNTLHFGYKDFNTFKFIILTLIIYNNLDLLDINLLNLSQINLENKARSEQTGIFLDKIGITTSTSQNLFTNNIEMNLGDLKSLELSSIESDLKIKF